LALSAPAPVQQQPTFGAVVSRVRVDVLVTDRNGRFIDDLSPEDFLVYEDEQPQEVLTVQLVDSGTRTVVDLSLVLDRGTPPQPGEHDIAELPPTEPSVSNLGAMVFLIDGYSLGREARLRFAHGWKEILDATDSFNVPRAAYLTDATGKLRELAPLSYEVDHLSMVADEVLENSVPRVSLESRLLELYWYKLARDETPPRDRPAPKAAEGVRPARPLGPADMEAMEYEDDELRRSLANLELLEQFCNSLAARSGRTALVWVSAGVKRTMGGPFWALAGDNPLLNSALHPGIVEAQTALHEAANSSNVSIYALDPTADSDQRSLGLDTAAPRGAFADLQSSEVQWALSGLRDSLASAAEATGGKAFLRWSDVRGALREIEDDGRQYYLLTYAAPAPHGDREYHEIRVEVARPDVDVRARQGYLDLPEDERRHRAMAAALALPGTVTGMAVEAEAIRRWSGSGDPIVQLLASMDLSASEGGMAEEILEEAAQGEQGEAGAPLLEILAAAVDGGGEIVNEVHEMVRGVVSTRSEAGGAAAQPFVYVQSWSLAPGDHELRVAVRDTTSGRLGAARVPVEVPEIAAGWRTSDLMLLINSGDGTPQHLVRGRVAEGETVTVYVEVANGEEPAISGRIFDAEAIDAPSALLPARHLQRDASGIHRGGISIRGLPAGIYSLEVSVTDARADREKDYIYTLEVVGQPGTTGL
jgi:VWFA-related protein